MLVFMQHWTGSPNIQTYVIKSWDLLVSTTYFEYCKKVLPCDMNMPIRSLRQLRTTYYLLLIIFAHAQYDKIPLTDPFSHCSLFWYLRRDREVTLHTHILNLVAWPRISSEFRTERTRRVTVGCVEGSEIVGEVWKLRNFHNNTLER